jgi:zinc protease
MTKHPLAGRTRIVAATLAGTLAAVYLLAPSAAATEVKTVRSPSGIEARLVENNAVPLIAVNIIFKGGASQDPDGKAGLANFANCMFNEGAGNLRTQELMQKLHVDLSAQFEKAATDESHVFNFKTVTAYKDDVFDLVGEMFQEPRFDEDAMGRCRDEIGITIDAGNQSSATHQRLALYGMLFGDHPLARQTNGSRQSIAAITKEDVLDYRRRVFARDNMMIAVVGNIDATTLGDLLDRTFGKLPANSDLKPELPLPPATAGIKVLDYDVPQASIIFGNLVKLENDTERAAADIITQVIGGGDLDSRMMMELRERRGLIYSVSMSRGSTLLSDFVMGGAATDNDKVAEVIALIRREMELFLEGGMSEEEFARAKSVLKGSRLIGTRLSPSIAARLAADWFWGKGPDYFNTYGSRIDSVTRDDVRRVAQKVLNPAALSIVVVGKSVKL